MRAVAARQVRMAIAAVVAGLLVGAAPIAAGVASAAPAKSTPSQHASKSTPTKHPTPKKHSTSSKPPAPTAAQLLRAQNARCGLNRGKATYHGTSSSRNLRRAIPDPLKVVAFPCRFPSAVRGIRIEPTSITLVAGGHAVRTIPFAHAGQTVTLPEISAAIADPSWMSISSTGVATLEASLVQERGTSLLVAKPVTALHIVSNRDESIAGSHAKATFSGVTVSSWDDTTNAPVAKATDGRPFVLYENGSSFNISGCTFEYLGSDVSSSYGVSWRQGGTSGVVNHSVFQHNFFGVYTYRASGVVFENSTFRDNVYYGLDPHTYSSHLTIRGNNVYGNGDHGIVFSRFVTDSVVAHNNVHDNKVNGIMMDYHSDDNVIRDNTVTDNAEGIVFSGSAGSRAFDNTVTGNQVGVRGSHDGADSDNVYDNTITGGRLGVQLYGGAAAFTLRKNTISGASSIGMEIDAARTKAIGNVISATPTAIKAESVTNISGGRLTPQKDGIVVTDQGFANISTVAVSGTKPLTLIGNGFAHLTSTSFGLPAAPGSVSTLDLIGISILCFACCAKSCTRVAAGSFVA